jgi:hypothetical protein
MIKYPTSVKFVYRDGFRMGVHLRRNRRRRVVE